MEPPAPPAPPTAPLPTPPTPPSPVPPAPLTAPTAPSPPELEPLAAPAAPAAPLPAVAVALPFEAEVEAPPLVADHCLHQRRQCWSPCRCCHRSPKQCRSRTTRPGTRAAGAGHGTAGASPSRSSCGTAPVAPPPWRLQYRYPRRRYWLPSEWRRPTRRSRYAATIRKAIAADQTPRPRSGLTRPDHRGRHQAHRRNRPIGIACACGAAHAGTAAEGAAAQAGTQCTAIAALGLVGVVGWRSAHPKLRRQMPALPLVALPLLASPAEALPLRDAA